jgi:hypothetical protein
LWSGTLLAQPPTRMKKCTGQSHASDDLNRRIKVIYSLAKDGESSTFTETR